MNFCLVSVSKVEPWNFLQFLHLSKILLMNFTKSPVADAIILPVEFCVLVLLELLGIRDEKFSRNILR